MGATTDCNSSRRVVVEDHRAKLIPKSLRRPLVQSWIPFGGGIQPGTRPHAGCEFASLVTHMFFAWGKHANRRSAVLFMDFVSAYDNVLHELLLGITLSYDVLCQRLIKHVIPSESVNTVAQTILQESPALSSAEVEPRQFRCFSNCYTKRTMLLKVAHRSCQFAKD